MSYDTEVMTDSPLVYLELNDGSGTTAADTSGNSRNGTYATTSGTGYVLNQTGIIASRTDGNVSFVNAAGAETHSSTGYALVGYGAWMNLTGDMTCEVWYSPPATGITTGILVGRRSAVLQFQILAAASGQFAIAQWDAANVGYQVFSSGIDMFTDRRPYHVVLVKSGTTLSLYVDGVLHDSVTMVSAVASNTADALGINSAGNAGSNGCVGRMACVALYGTALSAARIAAHYTAGAAKIAFLDQQWALLVGQSETLSPVASTTDIVTFEMIGGMLLDDSVTATSSMSSAYLMAMALSNSATAAAAMAATQLLGITISNTATAVGTVATSGLMSVALSDTVTAATSMAPNAVFGMLLSDTATVSITIQAGDTTYSGWIVNPKLLASTAADGMNFNSFVTHKSITYGVAKTGIFKLGGDTDAGANINSFVGLPQINFGVEQQKRVPYAYIGVTADSQMVLRVLVAGQTYTYTARNTTPNMNEQRVDMGLGLRGSYWQFELMNAGGADFELDNIRFMPIVLGKRI